jgi:hypothetical protein
MSETCINLLPEIFSEKEKVLVVSGSLSASSFRFDSGVAGLRLKNGLGELVMLPFQGQQIWSAQFNGHNLTMRSMFDQPHPTRVYLETYGGFLLHCGATAMGVPTKEDNHPLHGELPNAPYQKAFIIFGVDEKGTYIGLGGSYQHTVAFNSNYIAQPVVKLYAGSSVFSVAMDITNLKNSPMDLMYLAHANFRPINQSRLVYSAQCTPEHVRVRTSIPSHVHPGPEYVGFLEELKRNPKVHNILSPDLAFDPEVVFFVDYLADDEGWAHTMQVYPDGSADYIRHKPSQLDKGVRWICRTADQDALGMVLPATAEPEGYSAEKAKGNIKVLDAKSNFNFEMEMGVLSKEQAEQMENHIIQILNNGKYQP